MTRRLTLYLLFVLFAINHSIVQAERPSDSEVLEFIAKHVPEASQELKEIKQHEPQEYRNIVQDWKEKITYYFELKEQDKQLADDMLKAEQLEFQSWRLAEKIHETEDPNKKKQLVKKLRGLLEKVFDARLRGRKFETSKLKEELGELQRQIQKREANRDEIITRHLEEMVGPEDESLSWW